MAILVENTLRGKSLWKAQWRVLPILAATGVGTRQALLTFRFFFQRDSVPEAELGPDLNPPQNRTVK